MAWQVSKRVWDSIKTEGDKKKDIDASERLVLLALADKADENGICWPKFDTSYQTLADMVGVNRRSAMRLVENLCDIGHLWKSETAGRGHSNTFIVTIGLSQPEIKERLALIGVIHNTIIKEEKVLPETPKEEPKKEMVLPVTRNGVIGDTNKPANGVMDNTQSIIKSPSELITPNGVGKKLPGGRGEKENHQRDGPKRILAKEFTALTGIEFPTNDKPSEGFWWNKLGVIYDLAGKDVEAGKRLMREAVDRRGVEDIYTPNSLVNTIRKIIGEKNHKPKLKASAK